MLKKVNKKEVTKEVAPKSLNLPQLIQDRIKAILEDAKNRKDQVDQAVQRDISNMAAGFLADKKIPEGFDASINQEANKIEFIKRE